MKARIYLAILIFLYCLLFHWVYVDYLFFWFEYMGYTYKQPSVFLLFLGYLTCLIPVIWIKIGLTRPSLIIYWFLYLFTYITAILTFTFCGSYDILVCVKFFTCMLFAFFIIGIPYFIKTVNFKSINLSKKIFWAFTFTIISLLLGYVLFIFRGNLKISSLDNVYDQRFAADDIMNGNLSGYAIMLLAACFFPLLIAYGISQKKYLFLVLGTLGEIIMFTTLGAKSHLFSTLIMVCIYLLIRKKQSIDQYGIKLTMVLVIAGILIMLAQNLFIGSNSQSLFFILGGLYFVRTQSMGGLLMSQYYTFFSSHPHTYWSHIRVLRDVLGYPYQLEIGQEIGSFFYGEETTNANANFWATDGIAASGLIGLIFISIIVALIFYIIDSLANKHHILFATLLLVFTTLSLLNASLFTTLFSGGLFMVMVILYLCPSTKKLTL